MAAGAVEDDAVARGVAYLVRGQGASGFWTEKRFTATGFPRVFYLRYHGYAKFFPLWAVARYRNLIRAITARSRWGCRHWVHHRRDGSGRRGAHRGRLGRDGRLGRRRSRSARGAHRSRHRGRRRRGHQHRHRRRSGARPPGRRDARRTDDPNGVGRLLRGRPHLGSAPVSPPPRRADRRSRGDRHARHRPGGQTRAPCRNRARSRPIWNPTSPRGSRHATACRSRHCASSPIPPSGGCRRRRSSACGRTAVSRSAPCSARFCGTPRQVPALAMTALDAPRRVRLATRQP